MGISYRAEDQNGKKEKNKMNKRTIFGLLLLTVVALGEIGISAAGVSGGPAPAADGAALYTAYCEHCHGANGLKGTTAVEIKRAINSVPQMSGLKSLSRTDIRAIASFLSTRTK